MRPLRHARRLLLALTFLAPLLGASLPDAAQARASHHTTASSPANGPTTKGTTTKGTSAKGSTAKGATAKGTAAAPAPVVALPALLVDMATGDVLYAENAGAPWHPASLTKLMTAYVAFQAIAEHRVSLDSVVTMSTKAVSQAPATSGLPRGDSLTLRDALYIMLVKSANDMAVAIAETVSGSTEAFAAEMNATAQRLGLSRTHYDNVNGLPDEDQVTTARDLAVLAIDLRRTFPQYDDIYRTQAVQLGKVRLKASNDLLSRLDGTTGMKTGYICASGLNIVATVRRGDRELLAVILGGSSARERDQLAARLVLRGFAGEFADEGRSVVELPNDMTAAPVDMKPLLCGRQAKAYVASRVKAFPFGLRGQPSYLGDRIAGDVHVATDFGVPGAAPAVIAPTDESAQGDTDAGDPSVAEAAASPASVPMPRPRRAR